MLHPFKTSQLICTTNNSVKCYFLDEKIIHVLSGFQRIKEITGTNLDFTKPSNQIISRSSRHCVKNVRIRSFSDPNAGKYRREKLQIWTIFKQ